MNAFDDPLVVLLLDIGEDVHLEVRVLFNPHLECICDVVRITRAGSSSAHGRRLFISSSSLKVITLSVSEFVLSSTFSLSFSALQRRPHISTVLYPETEKRWGRLGKRFVLSVPIKARDAFVTAASGDPCLRLLAQDPNPTLATSRSSTTSPCS